MPGLPADTHIGHVDLTVSDLDRALAFYTGVLGFEVMQRKERGAALAPPGGRVLLRLTACPGAQRRSRRSAGLYHFAILVPTRAALGRSLRRLIECRWPLTGASDHLVSEALYLDDPDGLGIEIYRDRPRETWAHDAGEVRMATEPLDLEGLAREPGADRLGSGLEADTVIGHVHLHVPDLAEAERLYCDEIGFTPTLRRYAGALFVAAGGYHHHLGLNVWAGHGAPPPAPGTVGLESFSLESATLEPRTIADAATGLEVRCTPVR
jgi:catechol 2,3-dioxygenase